MSRRAWSAIVGRRERVVMPESELELEIRAIEERLLDRRVRSSPHLVGELLAEEFVEFGSSGWTWSKREILDALPGERGARATVSGFEARLMCADVELATYRVVVEPEPPEPSRASLRSSIWVHRAGRWQLFFHQGTPSGRS